MAADNIVHSKNISLSLTEYAQKKNCDVKTLDFTLLGLQTYFKTSHHQSFIKFHDDYKKEYSQSINIIKDHVRFVQIYKIRIHPKEEENIKLIYRLEMGEFSTHPLLIISPDSTLPLHELKEQEMLKKLYTKINKIKAENKMIVNLFSSCMVKDLKELVHRLYKDGFNQEESILLFQGILPEIAQPSKVINHYKQKSTSEKVTEVDESELIITYEKPIYGEAGLNAMGQRISQGSSNNLAKLEYEIDNESIRTKENKNEICYYSKKRGYVSTLNNTLTISNKLVVENINRVDAKLTKNEENKVSVVVSQTDVTKDGVGEGVELVSESIHITGHMGAKSSIEAKSVVIDGATHNSAFVTAKMAKINRHKGTLRCHKAEINSLEGGTVYATNVKINAALGGQICAEHVTIKSVKHNLKIFASKSITIERILGEDNHFIIDYRKLPVLQSRLHFLSEEYDELSWKYEDAKKHSPDKLSELKEALSKKDAEIKEITLSHYNAVITIMAPIDGLNTIEFAIPEKQQTLIYRTKESKTFEPFYIQKSDDKIILYPVGVEIEL